MKCKHKNVVFLGKQKLASDDYLPLFNCLTCQSTITIRVRKQRPMAKEKLTKIA